MKLFEILFSCQAAGDALEMHHRFFAGISWFFRVQSQQNLRKWLNWQCIQYASQQKLPEEGHPMICIFHRKSFLIEFVNVYEKTHDHIVHKHLQWYYTVLGVIIEIMSICVCPSFVPCPLLFIEKILEVYTWNEACLWPEGVLWPYVTC